MDVFSHNGVIKPKDQAVVSLFSIELTYGFGVYESIRAVKGVAKYVDMHVERLFASADHIRLSHQFEKRAVVEYIADLVEQIDSPAFNLKLLLVGGKTDDTADLYILPLAPSFPNRTLYKHGAHAITVRYERYLPHAKSLNMLPSYLAYRDAKEAGAYDALLVNQNGDMLEGTRTNLFALEGSTLYTPPVDQVLEGVTRINVLACAHDNGFEVIEQSLPLDNIGDYDSFFLTSTSSKIMPLRSIDEQSLEISDELRRLMKAFDSF